MNLRPAVPPGFGKLTNSIRPVSNGKALEETIGVPADNEVSLYTRDGTRILLTHYCAMTPDGHQVRLATAAGAGAGDTLVFQFAGAPHMRRVVLTYIDHDHFTEKWTKTENGKETVFALNFVRR